MPRDEFSSKEMNGCLVPWSTADDADASRADPWVVSSPLPAILSPFDPSPAVTSLCTAIDGDRFPWLASLDSLGSPLDWLPSLGLPQSPPGGV